MFEKGQKVYCYYDDIVPLVEGTIADDTPQEYEINRVYYKVHWDMYGVSYFPFDRIFTSKSEWQSFYNKKLIELDKEKEITEYNLYLKLKEKYAMK